MAKKSKKTGGAIKPRSGHVIYSGAGAHGPTKYRQGRKKSRTRDLIDRG